MEASGWLAGTGVLSENCFILIKNYWEKQKSQKCEFCDFTCIQKGNLVRHLHIHSRKKSYKCKKCHFSTNQKAGFEAHMYTHTEEKKAFKCHYCNSSFNTLACNLFRWENDISIKSIYSLIFLH